MFLVSLMPGSSRSAYDTTTLQLSVNTISSGGIGAESATSFSDASTSTLECVSRGKLRAYVYCPKYSDKFKE